MTKIIPNGTTVTWSNNTVYGPKFKTGTVLVYVPAWEKPYNVLGRSLEPNERIVNKADGLKASKNARYLVAVPRGGKSALVDIYTPYVSQVVRV
jgi:hypothetical protein